MGPGPIHFGSLIRLAAEAQGIQGESPDEPHEAEPKAEWD
jgi:hypothetical protein